MFLDGRQKIRTDGGHAPARGIGAGEAIAQKLKELARTARGVRWYEQFLELVEDPEIDARVAEAQKLVQAALDAGIPLTTNQVGGMFGIFFTEADQVTDYAGATACDVARFRAFFHAMLARGQYLAPSAFEAGFVSAAHAEADLAATCAAAGEVFSRFRL
mgnify:CR=1 FL=1